MRLGRYPGAIAGGEPTPDLALEWEAAGLREKPDAPLSDTGVGQPASSRARAP
jgi:hypothetical protein